MKLDLGRFIRRRALIRRWTAATLLVGAAP